MTLMVSVLMACLAIANTMIGRSILYPPAFFTALWSALLVALYLSGDLFYSISSETLLIYFLGSLAFSIGGAIKVSPLSTYSGLSWPKGNRPFVNKFLDIALVILVMLLPVYFRRLMELAALSGLDNFWIGIRAQTSSGIWSEEGLGILEYVISFATFTALAAFYEKNNSRWAKMRATLLIIITFVYQIATVSRTGATLTLLSLTGIALIQSRKIKLKIALTGVLMLLVVFSVPAILLNKGGSIDASITENISSISENIQMYTLGSLVAFDHVVVESPPRSLGLLTFRFFINVANSLGASIELPSSVLEYAEIPNLTNVYTIYYPYYVDFGMFGVIIIMFFLGLLISLVYKLAIGGSPEAIILYGMCFGSMILTNLGDPFIVALSFWIQAIFWISVLYRLPRLTINTTAVNHRPVSRT